jgi:21S rRNA (GM2251-2'-O)-methyltransferase
LLGKRNISELIIQEGLNKDDEIHNNIINICNSKNIPIRTFDKHNLNMLSENRPHQGYILRALPLEFIDIKKLDTTNNTYK